MGRSHAVCGAAAGAWLAVALPAVAPSYVALGVLGAAVASQAPDLDHPNSRATKAIPIIGPWVISPGLRAVSQVTTGVAHRGLTHSLVFGLMLAALVAWPLYLTGDTVLTAYGAAAVFAGVAAALLGDLVTRASLDHLFWPFGFRVWVPVRLRIRTGGPAENYVVFPLAVLATVGGLIVRFRTGV